MFRLILSTSRERSMFVKGVLNTLRDRHRMGIVVLSTKYEDYGLHAIIKGRRSVRRYAAAEVNPGLVDRLLLAAASAPSAHNRQPWRFAILEDAIWKDRLAKAMGNRLREDRLADGDDPDEVAGDVARSYARITEAPLVILVCLDTRDMDQYPDERRRVAEHVMAIQSTAMAMQNILLAAHAEGMGACVMCAPLFCGPAVVAALRLPDGWEPQSLVTLGPPANEGKERPRLPLEQIIWRPDA
jgi:coenzyme F420-0:L-glutamate ligase/coenzyme F420-1:gamma-L-glutamate ligase